MRIHGRSIRLCALLLLCIATLFAAVGCGGKDAEATKPASGEYYTGAMDKKQAAAPNGAGRISINSQPGKPQ